MWPWIFFSNLRNRTQALGEFQLQNEELRTQIRQLNLRTAQLQANQRKRTPKVKSQAPEDKQIESDAITVAGKKYSVMYFPWTELDWLTRRLQPNINVWNSEAWFMNEKTQKSAHITKVIDVLESVVIKNTESSAKILLGETWAQNIVSTIG